MVLTCILEILKMLVTQNKQNILLYGNYLPNFYGNSRHYLKVLKKLFLIIHKIIILLNVLVEMHIKLVYNMFCLVFLYCAFMLTTCIIDDVIILRLRLRMNQ